MVNLKGYLNEQVEQMTMMLKTMIELESPSTDKEAVDKYSNFLTSLFTQTGCGVEILNRDEIGNHLRAEWGNGNEKIFIPCHMDTVWPLGEVIKRPFRIENGKAYGPGILDMKAGILQVVFALKTIHELGLTVNKKIVILCNSDEELQSKDSRSLIEKEAYSSDVVLVPEPAMQDKIITARKGSYRYHFHICGKEAHAGSGHAQGINALQEMAHLILYLHSFTNYEIGTTVNVGIAQGGTRANVVAGEASGEMSVRVSTKAEEERMIKELESYNPTLPDSKVRVWQGYSRPIFERTEEVARLFKIASKLADELGITVEEGMASDASDGNFTAALGVPTLDGLGGVGHGAHAIDEHIIVRYLPERTALLIRLLQVL